MANVPEEVFTLKKQLSAFMTGRILEQCLGKYFFLNYLFLTFICHKEETLNKGKTVGKL